MKSRYFVTGIVAFALTNAAIADNNGGTQNVMVTNPATNPVQVKVTNNPLPVSGNVGIMGTPTVNIGNSIKPGQMVVQFADSNNTGCDEFGEYPFSITIPSGMVLVVNEVTVSTSGDSTYAGKRALIDFITFDGTNRAFVGSWFGTLDSNGIFSHDFHFAPGLVIKSGLVLCTGMGISGIGPVTTDVPIAILSGYLAKDE